MLDKQAIDNDGRAGYTLMESAGTALFNCYRKHWPLVRRILVLAGPGNNGGDGYVVAALAARAGHQVSVVSFGQPVETSDAYRARQRWLDDGGKLVQADQFGAVDAAGEWINGHHLVVDALLGTGLSRAPAEDMAHWIKAINRADIPVVAADLPSGLNSDTGIAPGAIINAAATVTFIGRKQGLYTGQGPDHCGDIVFDDLGISATVYEVVVAQSQLVVSGARHLPLLGPRRRSSHKGDHGHLLLIAGGPGMAGAAMIAGRAALRSGSGLVSVVTHPDNVAAVVGAQPEMMVHAADLNTDLTSLIERADVVAMGPGLGKESWAKQLWESISTYNGPLVVDADGLNLLAASTDQQSAQHRDNWVLTPHVGEAARLLGCDREQIEQDRFGAVTAIQQQYGGVALLKGAGSLIADDQDIPVAVRGGNPGMASGGMGDALTGVIGAFIAQGLAINQAAVLGAAAHAWAADLAANETGERGLLATDLISCLPAIINGNFDSVQAENFDPDYESAQAVFSG